MNAKRKTANAKRKNSERQAENCERQAENRLERWSFYPKATVRDSLAAAPNRRQDRTRLHSVSALSTTARRAERCLFRI